VTPTAATEVRDSGRNSELQALLDSESLRAYVARLAALLDDFKVGEFVEEFCDDGHYTLIPRENHERGYPVTIIDDTKKRLRYRQKLIENHWRIEKFRELRMLSPVCMDCSGDTARGKTNFVIYRTDDEGSTKFHLAGVFHDDFRRHEGRWRIERRLAILDTYLPTEAVVLPP